MLSLYSSDIEELPDNAKWIDSIALPVNELNIERTRNSNFMDTSSNQPRALSHIGARLEVFPFVALIYSQLNTKVETVSEFSIATFANASIYHPI